MFYESIKLHFLPSLGRERMHITLTAAPVNVLVGPNGAGKSLALRELASLPNDRKIICGRRATRETLRKAQERHRSLDFLVDEETADKIAVLPEDWHSDLRSFRVPNLADHADIAAMEKRERQNWRHACSATVQRLEKLEARRVVLSAFSSLGQVGIGERGRFANSPKSRLDALYRDRGSLETLRNIIFENFGLYPVIDVSGAHLVLRLSRTRPAEGLEYVHSPESEAFMDRASTPDDLSDGTRTYLGLWAHLLSGDERLIFLDEAGSMLHPPLARQLGKQLANVAQERRGHLFAATHSADFLLGCIQAGCKVNVIRLTHREGVSTARILSAEDLRPLMYDPLMRSSNVLSGLFHDGVVVCEADADRVFYQEINERLLAGKEGMPSCHFVNAQNWQTIPRITTALRGLGIPAAMLIDLDAVIHPDIYRLLESVGAPSPILLSLGQLRGELAREFDPKEKREKKESKDEKAAREAREKKERQERRDQLKREGLGMITEAMRPSWRKYLRDLAEYGIFAVPVGELESWLPELGVPRGHKGNWIVQTFAGMGSDPADTAGYLRPAADGPWEFMRSIAKWLQDPERQGMPPLPMDPTPSRDS